MNKQFMQLPFSFLLGICFTWTLLARAAPGQEPVSTDPGFTSEPNSQKEPPSASSKELDQATELEFKELAKEIQLGVFPPNQKKQIVIRFRNELDKPIEIVGAVGSCSCTDISVNTKQIDAGEMISLDITLKVGPKVGNVGVTGYVYFHRQSEPQSIHKVRFAVKYLVRSPLTFPSDDMFSEIDPAAPELVKFSIENHSASRWQDLELVLSEPDVAEEVKLETGQWESKGQIGEPTQLFSASLKMSTAYLQAHVGETISSDLVLLGKLDGETRAAHRIGSARLRLRVKRPVEVKPTSISVSGDASESIDLHFFSRDGKRKLSPDQVQVLGEHGEQLNNVELLPISPRWIRIRITREELQNISKGSKRIELRSNHESIGVASDFVDLIE